MGDEQVPDDGLKLLRVRGYGCGGDGGNDEAGVGYLRGIAAVATHDTPKARADLFRQDETGDQIHADVVLRISAADGEDEDAVAPAEMAASQPVGITRFPAVVVDARC